MFRKVDKTVVLTLLTAGLLLVQDSLTELGVSDWVLYFIPLLFSSLARRPSYPYIFAAVCTVFLVSGLFLSPPGIEPKISFTVRALGVLVFWTTAVLLVRRRAVEDQLRKLTSELDKLVVERTAALQESKDDIEAFSYTIVHNLRAPLRAMRSFTKILMEDHAPELTGEARDFLQRINKSAAQMEQLIHDLLEYNRVNHTSPVPAKVDLQDAVERALYSLKTDLEAKKASVHVIEPLGRAIADRNLLDQVLMNLISNAIKFTRPGSPPQIEIQSEIKNESVRVWVRDHGIGIEPEFHQRIFGVFERLHGIDVFPGTGVGLAICRKAIQQMGGRIGVTSAPNEGSSFWFELPKAPSTALQRIQQHEYFPDSSLLLGAGSRHNHA